MKTENHGEKVVKVMATQPESKKGNGKGKSSSASAVASAAKGSDKPTGSKVTVTKVTPKIIPLPFLSEQPAEGTRGTKKRKKDDGSKGDK